MVARLQFGAAGLATRVGSAPATDAATALTAVTAATAMAMDLLIDVPSFVARLVNSRSFDVETARELSRRPADERLPALVA
jgi:hypothetical protein